MPRSVSKYHFAIKRKNRAPWTYDWFQSWGRENTTSGGNASKLDSVLKNTRATLKVILVDKKQKIKQDIKQMMIVLGANA